MAVIVPTFNDEGKIKCPSNRPVLNTYTILLVLTSAVGGFLFGYDTGIISSAMLYVENNYDISPLSNFWKELIVAITPGFAIFGSLSAGPLSDRYGRKPLIIMSSIVFTVGAVMCAGAFDKWVLLGGRMFLGIGVGISSMLVSVYVSESSPKHIRGGLLTFCNAAITFGQMAANIIAGGFSYIDPDNLGWRFMFGFAAIPAVIQFVGFLFLPESPRWLLKQGQESRSKNVLSKIYSNDSDWINYEVDEIKAALEQERIERKGRENVLRAIWTTKHIRKALLVGCSLQAFQQLGGINTIMYYTGAIIKSAGVRDNHTTIWLSVITAGVNFVGTLVPMMLIDRIGRKKMLLTSVFGVVCSLCLMGGAFVLVNVDTAKTLSNPNLTFFDDRVKHFERCASHSNCDFCVTDERCGFCALSGGKHAGYCLPMDADHPDTMASTGYCGVSAVNGSMYEWGDVYCHTQYTYLPIVIMVIYLSFFSMGMGPVPWVLNAEFYPAWARGTCVSASTSINWIFNVIVSLTFLTLTELCTKFGTFFVYAAVTAVGGVIFLVYVPETKDKSIDEIEALFMDPEDRQQFFNQNKNVDDSYAVKNTDL